MSNDFGAVPHPPEVGKSGKGEVCKTFMRRLDPGPRLEKKVEVRG